MHVALNAVGGIHWMGGANYINNIVKSLAFLPGEERPELSLVMPGGVDTVPFQEAVAGCQRVLPMPFWGARHVVGCHRDSALKAFGKRLLGSTAVWRMLRSRMQCNSFRKSLPLLREAGVDVVFPLQFSVGGDFALPWIGWVPDLQYRRLPQYFADHVTRAYDQVNEGLARDAPLVVVSSQDSASDFLRMFPRVGDRLRIFRFCTIPKPEWFAGDPAVEAAALGVEGPYFVIPNQFVSHKNHEVALEAWRCLRDRGVDATLICTGDVHDVHNGSRIIGFRDFLARHHLEGRVLFTGILPRVRQVQLLRGAVAILQPSRFEGWSTVVEDARALGKPLILSDLAIHREQDPPMTEYFAPDDSVSLVRLVETMLARREMGGSYGSSGIDAAHRQRIMAMARSFVGICAEVGR
jgi:glycosyltransferase involved in cell wall biosynthesis